MLFEVINGILEIFLYTFFNSYMQLMILTNQNHLHTIIT